VPGAPALPHPVSAVERWQGAATVWTEDGVTACISALGEPDVNIFVGNLAFTTTEQTLRDLFASYGTVDTVRIMTDRETGRPRGFGFVEMPDGTAARRHCRTAGARTGRPRLNRERSTAA